MVDNHVYNLSDEPPKKIIDPWIIVDRVEIDTEDATQLDRLSQSLSTAFEHGEDVIGIIDFGAEKIQKIKKKTGMEIFSRAFRCPHC